MRSMKMTRPVLEAVGIHSTHRLELYNCDEGFGVTVYRIDGTKRPVTYVAGNREEIMQYLSRYAEDGILVAGLNHTLN